MDDRMQLDKVNIGRWQNYQSFSDQEQIRSKRENLVYKIMSSVLDLKMNIPVQSIIFCGPHGVGKTALINELQEIAEDADIFCKRIEVDDFVSQIVAGSQAFLQQVSTKEEVKDFVQKALETIKAFVVLFAPDAGAFSVSDRELYISNNLTQSLTDVFTEIGDIAYKTGVPICFFIDEMQDMKKEELGALIAAIHRTNQLGYPVMIIGTGLPKIYKMLSDEKSYSERLFMYKQIGDPKV